MEVTKSMTSRYRTIVMGTECVRAGYIKAYYTPRCITFVHINMTKALWLNGDVVFNRYIYENDVRVLSMVILYIEGFELGKYAYSLNGQSNITITIN